jgi:hypothetical protein
MDKSWINCSTRRSEQYIAGLQAFLDLADRSSKDGKILCPCIKCTNVYWHPRAVVFDHCICDGFLKGYVRWIFHGETLDPSTSFDFNVEQQERHQHNISEMLYDAFSHDERHQQERQMLQRANAISMHV